MLRLIPVYLNNPGGFGVNPWRDGDARRKVMRFGFYGCFLCLSPDGCMICCTVPVPEELDLPKHAGAV